MLLSSYVALAVAIGSRGLAKADCLVADDWTDGPQCVSGHGGDLSADIVADLVTCMLDKTGGNVTVGGNGLIPDYGSGESMNWYKDDYELYMINAKMDDVCIDTNATGKLVNDGYEDDCININWSTGEDWMVKLGVARCDAVYGCDKGVGDSTEC